MRILGVQGTSRSAEFPGWESGSVALKKIKIQIPKRWDEAVDCDAFVNEVNSALESFKVSDIEAIAGIASNRGGA